MKLLILPIIVLIVSLYALPKIAVQKAQIKIKVEAQKPVDPRVATLRHYLQSRASPLAEASEDIIEIADHYGLDYRLFIGIANAESSLGKHIPEGSYNPYGFACFDGQPCHYFKSYKEATESLAGTLTNHYAYAKWNSTGDVNDLAAVYLTGDKKRWVGNVQTVMNDLNEKDQAAKN